ncbi:MAG: GNAT family N-acetyltransferase [Bacteroidota bacterium]
MNYRLVTHAQVPRLSAQLASLSNLAFAEYEGAPQVDEAFIDWYLRRPGSTPGLCIAALYGEQLVANVLVALQPLNIGGEFILCGLVDTVATHPDHRQQGLARRLMDMAHELMREHGALAGVLYTNPANHPYQFYSRMGYYTRAQAGMLTGTRPTPCGECTVRPMAVGEAAAVRSLINDHYSSYEGFTPLDEALWHWHRDSRPANMPDQIIVAEAGGALVGTAALADVEVLLGETKSEVTVLSDAVYPDVACLREMLSLAPQEKLMSLQALDAPEREDLEQLGFVTSVGEVSMILPLDGHVKHLMHNTLRPWYVMVESVVGA